MITACFLIIVNLRKFFRKRYNEVHDRCSEDLKFAKALVKLAQSEIGNSLIHSYKIRTLFIKRLQRDFEGNLYIFYKICY